MYLYNRTTLYLKTKLKIFFFVLIITIKGVIFAQSISEFKLKNKWGFKKGESIIIEPQYDTTFGFDQTNSVALVGNINPNKKSINPLTKEVKLEWNYFYITNSNKKVYIKHSDNDSTYEVSIAKQIPALYLNNNPSFVAMVKEKKYLLRKKGGTIQTSAFDHIHFTKVPDIYMVETKDPKNGQTYFGLIDTEGKFVVQQVYSKIRLNSYDSLLICCTAGVKYNGSDDVYNYKGQKVHSSPKHIQYCGKNYAVYKLFESENAYIIYDITNSKEHPLKAEWVYYLKNDNLVLLDGDWYFYDMKTAKRFPIDKKLITYFNLDE